MHTLPLLPVRSALLGAALFLLPWPSQAEGDAYAEPPTASYRVEAPPAKGVASADGARAPAPKAALLAAVRARGVAEPALASLTELSDSLTVNGMRHVHLQQRLAGMPVHGGTVRGIFNGRGELVHVVSKLATLGPAAPLAAVIDEAQALRIVLEKANRRVPAGAAVREGLTVRFGDADEVFLRPPEVSRVVVPLASGSLVEGFLVKTWARQSNQLDHTLVAGDGRVLSVQGRTAHDSYHVYTESPEHGPQTMVEGPDPGHPNSPAGWLGEGGHRTIDIHGNNVHAFLDATSTWAPDPGGRAVSDGSFVAQADLTGSPSLATNQATAVQNLFYLVNRVHDTLHRHGYTEVAGNFQADNFGKGGLGGDPVEALAQQGSKMNNASFGTPDDGASPVMQMHLWRGASSGRPELDSALDSDVVFHEYGHGLTWRMIGNMSGPISGAIGEGASDTLAFLMNGRDTIGSYVSGKPGGIRRYPYGSHPLGYADVQGVDPHPDGEIYAAAMWRLRELWLASGRSNDSLFSLWVDAMNYIAPGPAYEDMRNGLLDAVAHGGGQAARERCAMVWQAFAERGIGDGAKGQVIAGKIVVTPSSVARADCSRPS